MAKTTITIDEQQVPFKASAYTPILYGQLFSGCDFLNDIDELENDMRAGELNVHAYEIFARVAFCLHFQALGNGTKRTEEQEAMLDKYGSAYDWIDEFSAFSIYQIFPQLMLLWAGQAVPAVTLQKKTRERAQDQ